MMQQYIKSLFINIEGKNIIKIQNPDKSFDNINNYLYELIYDNNIYKLYGVEHNIEVEYYNYIKTQVASININNIFGFIYLDAKNIHYIFKTKYSTIVKSKGFKCNDMKKSATIQRLNHIIGTSMYNKENTGDVYIPELCCAQEFILRYFDSINKNKLRWMFTYEDYLNYIKYHTNI